ncbi:MAG: IS1595 family transposase [Novosphingobium sp.]|nr:IS1595 family transposase [Novosphingobium sp.]MCP5403230.1 IS1595 family transposase [Novosphingobium sp.]
MFDLTNPIFTDADKAREHLEAVNWPDGPVCPHCGEYENVHRLQGKSHRAGLIQCNSCLKNFTVTVGTVFERSKVPLNKWLLATYLLASSKKGMSAHQLHRMLGVTYKTAWFMCHRIREAMKDDGSEPMGGFGKTVEADETYVGGKVGNRHASKRHGSKKLSPFKDKQPVVSLVEREGRVRSFHVANVNATTLRHVLVTNADRGSWLMTDEHAGYKKVGKEYVGHGVVSHSTGEYGRAGVFHTNTIENFFSIFKRGIIGVYHHVSEAHLSRYTTEFDFRYNTRSITDGERADAILSGIVGKRLTYRRTDAIAA